MFEKKTLSVCRISVSPTNTKIRIKSSLTLVFENTYSMFFFHHILIIAQRIFSKKIQFSTPKALEITPQTFGEEPIVICRR